MAVGDEVLAAIDSGCPTGMPAMTKSTKGSESTSSENTAWSLLLCSADWFLVELSACAAVFASSSVLCTSSVSGWLGESGVSDSTSCTSGSGDSAPPPMLPPLISTPSPLLSPPASSDATVSSKSTGGDGGSEEDEGADEAAVLRASTADVRAMDMGAEAGWAILMSGLDEVGGWRAF